MCQVHLEKNAHCVTAAISGEFILGCTSEIKEKVKSYMESSQQYHVIIDLSQVSFIDSSGLGALIAWFKMVNQHQGSIVFCGLTDHVRKIIGYAKLDKIFTIVDTTEKAETALNA